jgi:hypothetical protein
MSDDSWLTGTSTDELDNETKEKSMLACMVAAEVNQP